MPASLSPQEFVAKWKPTALREKQSYQEHFIDICRLLGHATPAEIDPKGQFFSFEAGATKLEGGQGWADVWYKGHFAWEYKGRHANLEKAYHQLQQYRESLENPPLLIVSDIDFIRIHTNFTNTVHKEYTLSWKICSLSTSSRSCATLFTSQSACAFHKPASKLPRKQQFNFHVWR